MRRYAVTAFWAVFIASIGLFVWLVVSHDANFADAQAAAGVETATGGERWATIAAQIIEFTVIAAVASVMAWRARFAWFGLIAATPVAIGLAGFLVGFLSKNFDAAAMAIAEIPLYWSQLVLVLLPAATMAFVRPPALRIPLRRASWGMIIGSALAVAFVYELGMLALGRDGIQQVPTALFLAGALFGATRRPTRILWAVPVVVAVHLAVMTPGLTLANGFAAVTMWTFTGAAALAGRSARTIERAARRRIEEAVEIRRLARRRAW